MVTRTSRPRESQGRQRVAIRGAPGRRHARVHITRPQGTPIEASTIHATSGTGREARGMTNVIVAAKPAASSGIAPAAPAPSRPRDVFLPGSVRRQTVLGTLRRRLRWPLGIYTTPVLILIVWEILAKTGFLKPTYAPAPSDIVSTTITLWRDGVLGPDLAISLQRAGIGLLLGLSVGIVTGVLGGFLRSGEYLFNGLAQILNTIPLLAVLPLMVVWFGIDELTKILLIAFGAGVPMYLNLFAAIRGVDQRLIEMARTTGAGSWRVVTRVLVPGALPGFLVGLRFSLAYSILGLVAAETVNADAGLGFLITQAQTYLQTNKVFVGLVIYSILGLVADQLVRSLERVLLRWRPSYEAT
jgi:sulfonate transport system permease protein